MIARSRGDQRAAAPADQPTRAQPYREVVGRHVTGTRSKSSAGLRPQNRHFAGTRPAPNDLRTISQLMRKRFTFVNVAPAIWRWRWHWRWCCRPQQRSERGPGGARAQPWDASDLRIATPGCPGPPRLCNALAVQARNPKRPRRAPPPCLDETALGRSGEESALRGTRIASDLHYKRQFTRAARGPQRPRALARGDVCGSTRSRRPDVSLGLGLGWGGVSVARDAYQLQIRLVNAILRALRAGRNSHRSRQRRRLRTRSGRPDVSFATKAPHAARAVSPARVASGERL